MSSGYSPPLLSFNREGTSSIYLLWVKGGLSDIENNNRYLIVKRFRRDVDEATAYLDHNNHKLKLNVL